MAIQKTLLSIAAGCCAAGYEANLDPRCELCVHSQFEKCAVILAYEHATTLPGPYSEVSEGAEMILACLIPDTENHNPICSLYWPTLRSNRRKK